VSPEALEAYSRGVRELARGDSVAAAPALEEATAADPSFGAAWLRLAAAYRQLGYDDKARDAAERASRELPDGNGRLALEARAVAAALAGETERSREILAELSERYPHDSAARLALAESYGDEGRFPEAREILEDLVEREPHHPRAWYLLGKFAILAGDSRLAADDYLVRALVIQNRLDNTQGRADVLNAMGIAHRNLGEIDRALERYQEAAELRREIGDRQGYAATLTNLGNLLFAHGDFEAGRERLEEAIGIFRELGSRSRIANLENEFGLLEEERGRYQDALEHFRRGLQMRQDLGDQRALAESLNNVGFAYYLLGDLDNAGVYWQRSLDLYEETGNREGVVIATQSLGLFDLARGEWPSAL
jgi:tetratricopeptide (TPR) repeat protein